jgi:hypothetical protein
VKKSLLNFAYKEFLMLVGFLHAVNLQHATDPPKEVVLWILIALKNPSSLAGFEPASLGCSG